MKFAMKGNKGFSLVELMIVVGIIGILASLAIPRLTIFMAKAKQAEVKTNLAAMTTLQRAYFVENNSVYGASAAIIGYNPPGGARYTYSSANTGVSTGTAAANALCTGSAVDTWTSDAASGALANTAPFGTCN